MHCCRAQRKLRPAAATVPALFVCAPLPRDDSKQTYGGTSPGPLDRFSIRSTQPPLSARLPPAGARRLSLPKGGAQMPRAPLARRDVEPTASDPPASPPSIYTPPRRPLPHPLLIRLVHSFVHLALAAGKLLDRGGELASGIGVVLECLPTGRTCTAGMAAPPPRCRRHWRRRPRWTAS
jgi:hypothetical protein